MMGPVLRLEDRLIALYQRVRAGKPSPCRYDPSCSAYARDALRVHGLLRGNLLMFRRLGRCQPFGGWGHDPIPDGKRQMSA